MPDDADELAALYGEIDILEHHGAFTARGVEGFGETLNFQERHGLLYST